MKSTSNKFPFLANSASLFFYLTCLVIISILSLHLISPQSKITVQEINQTRTSTQPSKEFETESSCDLFKGKWIRDTNATLYTSYSCATIPSWKNCLLRGRNDTDFLNWKWKPDQCELLRFDAVAFLSILRGKKMAFIGDSVARNQMDSLICLLSTVETPKPIGENSGDKSVAWEFPKHNFTLVLLWSQFLVAATEISVNGTTTGGYRLHLDRADTEWSKKLPSIDYAVFSSGHWYFRSHYLYEGGRVVGCIYCREPNTTDLGPGRAIRMAFRAALRAVNGCKKCKRIVTFVRTFSPPHFENGAWNTGGTCNRTRPIEREDVSREGPGWEYRKASMEELEMARNEGRGSVNEFEILDITEMMMMRADGHPSLYWGNTWMDEGVISDCVHWCLPGPIDTWNELLLEKIKRLDSMSTQN